MKIVMENTNKWLQIGRNQYICMLLGNNPLCVWKEVEVPEPDGIEGFSTFEGNIIEILD